MDAVEPYGDLCTATILVIGHDPRLQRSGARAKQAFFFEFLADPPPPPGPAARKYGLARAVWSYVECLAGRAVALPELYVTNLCNQFLEHIPGAGTVLIDDPLADRGVEEIRQVVAAGHFRVILPMAVQTFYHLCRTGFVEGQAELVSRFLCAAHPRESKAREGLYETVGRAPFLAACGQSFHHRGVPVVPIVHVKQWPLKARLARYQGPMQRAQKLVQEALRAWRMEIHQDAL